VRRWISGMLERSVMVEPSRRREVETPAPAPTKADRGPLDPVTLRNLRRLAPRENQQALAELIETFLDSTTARMPDLRRAVENRDSLMITQIAHSLKGSTGSFGALRLSGLLGQLEALGKNSVFAGMTEQLVEIEAEYEQVRAAFIQELASIR